ncbi:hypothetical protein PS664_02999 [Pseudomonas fluorescens]|nr:hypothetical protein PS664_02999 [Pseudomonas fluorescens]
MTRVELPSSSPITSTGMSPIGTSYADSNLLSIFSSPPTWQMATLPMKSGSVMLAVVCESPIRTTRSIPSNDGISAAWLTESSAREYQAAICWRYTARP